MSTILFILACQRGRNPRRHDRLIVTHDEPKRPAACIGDDPFSAQREAAKMAVIRAAKQPNLPTNLDMIIDIVSALTGSPPLTGRTTAAITRLLVFPANFGARLRVRTALINLVIFSFVFTTVMYYTPFFSPKKSITMRFVLGLKILATFVFK
jgi:hypothetical protein